MCLKPPTQSASYCLSAYNRVRGKKYKWMFTFECFATRRTTKININFNYLFDIGQSARTRTPRFSINEQLKTVRRRRGGGGEKNTNREKAQFTYMRSHFVYAFNWGAKFLVNKFFSLSLVIVLPVFLLTEISIVSSWKKKSNKSFVLFLRSKRLISQLLATLIPLYTKFIRNAKKTWKRH